MDIDGQRVWITGASSGIGAALAVACSKAGAQVVLSARRQTELEQVAAQCGDRADIQLLDVADPESIQAAVDAVQQRHGGVDVLINNAGITQRSTAVQTDMAVYRRLLEVNLFGTIALTSAVLPGMLSRGAGQIVAVASVAGKVGVPLRTGYCAAKHAVVGYCDALRAEVQDQGVGVLVVCPGFAAVVRCVAGRWHGAWRHGFRTGVRDRAGGRRDQNAPSNRARRARDTRWRQGNTRRSSQAAFSAAAQSRYAPDRPRQNLSRPAAAAVASRIRLCNACAALMRLVVSTEETSADGCSEHTGE